MDPHPNHSINFDDAISDVARIYRSITGRELPRRNESVAPIPPERDPRRVAEAALEELATALGRQAQPSQRLPPMLPAVDCWETGEEIVILADLPGVDRPSLRVELVEGALWIRGSRERSAPEGARPAALERLLDTFERRILLPRGITAEPVDAELHNGLLQLRLSRREGAAVTRTIDVR